jgi:HlyD family secretion protein
MLLVAAGSTLLCGCDWNTVDSSAVGTLERDRIDLVAEASEPILEILVREGERVRSEQPLLRLDARRLSAELERAKAARDRARAVLAELERGPRAERIAEARARLAGAESLLVTRQRELERARALRKRGIDPQAQLDIAQAQYDEALARRDEAQATLEALVEGATEEEIRQARASVAEAEAAVEAIRVSVERLTVRAPVEGLVDALPFEVGARPPAGGVVAVMLTNGAPYARVYVPEQIRVHVKPGTEARVRVDGIAEPFEGRVRTVSTEATFTPYLALTERDRGRLSYVAEVDLIDDEARDLPTGVPVEAIFAINTRTDD